MPRSTYQSFNLRCWFDYTPPRYSLLFSAVDSISTSYNMLKDCLQKGIGVVMSNERTETHFIGWVQRKHHNDVIYFVPEIFDDFKKACRSISSWDRDGAIKSLTEGIEMTQVQKMPPKEDLIGLPKIGQSIWVVKDWGRPKENPEERYEVFNVEVTELGIDDGEIWVIFGFYYKKKGKWFFTQKEAENLRQQCIDDNSIEAD